MIPSVVDLMPLFWSETDDMQTLISVETGDLCCVDLMCFVVSVVQTLLACLHVKIIGHAVLKQL